MTLAYSTAGDVTKPPVGIGEPSLPPAEIAEFEEQGFIGPYTLCSPEEMQRLHPLIDEAVERKSAPFRRDKWESRHQDCRVFYDICASPGIVGRISSLLGPDIVLWNSVVFNKMPGGREVPWHQDRDFLLLDPNVNCSAWLAIDDATPENGGLQFIPRSHGQQVPHVPRVRANQFNARADLAHVDRSKAVDMPLRAGQFVIFHKDALHHSAANLSLKRRMGLVVRLTVPGVKVNTAGLFSGHQVYVVRGEDRFGLNMIGTPPAH
jgi:ectoine hydroxylase-related dioxygenase (phytanoyl-CoA dioxygenase family)